MKELLSIMYHSAAWPGIRWLSTVAACLVCAIVTADAPTVLPKVHELVYTTHGTNKMLTTFYSCLENPHGFWGGAWRATAMRSQRVGTDWVTKCTHTHILHL